jgi:hypothetical protein
VGGNDTPIEGLFEKSLLERRFEGKKFDRTNAEKDGSKFYGKKVFATKIVAANKATINFGGFEPLLTAIVGAIDDYEAKIAPSLLPASMPIAAEAL